MKFTGRTALITGGVSGIGLGIARAFSAADIELILTYRDEGLRTDAERWFRKNNRPAPRFARLDVTDRGAWAQLADELGPVHIPLCGLRLDHGRQFWRSGKRSPAGTGA